MAKKIHVKGLHSTASRMDIFYADSEARFLALPQHRCCAKCLKKLRERAANIAVKQCQPRDPKEMWAWAKKMTRQNRSI